MTQFLEAVPVSWSRRCAGRATPIDEQLSCWKVVPSVTPDQFAEVYQVYLAGTDQPYPIENMAVIRALEVNARERWLRDSPRQHSRWGVGNASLWRTGQCSLCDRSLQDITERNAAAQLARAKPCWERSCSPARVWLLAADGKLLEIRQDSPWLRQTRSNRCRDGRFIQLC